MSRRTLRITLSVLAIGFAFEGAEELVSFLHPGATVPGAPVAIALPLVLAALGFLFIRVGEEEWIEAHRRRRRVAAALFSATLLAALVAGTVVLVEAFVPVASRPPMLGLAFGLAVGFALFGTFLTYGYLLHRLLSPTMRIVVLAGLVWTFVVAAAFGALLARNLDTLAELVVARRFDLPSFVRPAGRLLALLFLPYFFLAAAAVDAHFAVARGSVTDPVARGGASARRGR